MNINHNVCIYWKWREAGAPIFNSLFAKFTEESWTEFVFMDYRRLYFFHFFCLPLCMPMHFYFNTEPKTRYQIGNNCICKSEIKCFVSPSLCPWSASPPAPGLVDEANTEPFIEVKKNKIRKRKTVIFFIARAIIAPVFERLWPNKTQMAAPAPLWRATFFQESSYCIRWTLVAVWVSPPQNRCPGTSRTATGCMKRSHRLSHTAEVNHHPETTWHYRNNAMKS